MKDRGQLHFLVVGAGFAGTAIARRLADTGMRVRVIDRREHIGGNAFDEFDEQGLLVHRYGPHIFHTNSDEVVTFLSRFTDWLPYEHQVLSQVDGRLLPFPINRHTINQLYGLELDEAGVRAFLERVREPQERITNSEQLVLDAVGQDLYEKFFRGYTRKQWGMEPAELKAGVAARIPVRTDTDDRYFTDRFQAMPKDGYTRMFERMLDHPNITLELGTDFFSVRDRLHARHTVYTGPIDAYFGHCFGRLPYRSLHFEHTHIDDREWLQPVATINYPDEAVPWTRITEFKHMTGQQHPGTSIVREYPRAEGEPYYPVPSETSETLYRRYRDLAERETGVTFLGRLAQYRYYNMDQVVASALKTARMLLGEP
ncbi:UDP-galactopyranose mutase [endosymbiont of unidentified scaly snail isolate Monju]|uniref:UDP-galactopyranose mutase n=1 Tax=endosymbiont of unidentified scaly snail isolate Monju TaxID=1248727 RepID=UPI000389261A|nr:UDP-galactopyranose mutase [endosymbiont of unidentified scaly snail isolate Monju]BAN69954.1 UDP-galactopyranose mutase [endosymbiont of unidentified scaly snail isolate Monju]